jgi:hypothetical protein
MSSYALHFLPQISRNNSRSFAKLVLTVAAWRHVSKDSWLKITSEKIFYIVIPLTKAGQALPWHLAANLPAELLKFEIHNYP